MAERRRSVVSDCRAPEFPVSSTSRLGDRLAGLMSNLMDGCPAEVEQGFGSLKMASISSRAELSSKPEQTAALPFLIVAVAFGVLYARFRALCCSFCRLWPSDQDFFRSLEG